MVSRQHAQFQLHNGQWFITDNGSTYATFLDGQQISTAAPVRLNSRVQFGPQGPTLVVTRLGAPTLKPYENETIIDAPPHSLGGRSLQPDLQALPTTPPKHTAAPAFVEMSGTGTGQLHRVELTKEVTRFGREPGLERV